VCLEGLLDDDGVQIIDEYIATTNNTYSMRGCKIHLVSLTFGMSTYLCMRVEAGGELEGGRCNV